MCRVVCRVHVCAEFCLLLLCFNIYVFFAPPTCPWVVCTYSYITHLQLSTTINSINLVVYSEYNSSSSELVVDFTPTAD